MGGDRLSLTPHPAAHFILYEGDLNPGPRLASEGGDYLGFVVLGASSGAGKVPMWLPIQLLPSSELHAWAQREQELA